MKKEKRKSVGREEGRENESGCCDDLKIVSTKYRKPVMFI